MATELCPLCGQPRPHICYGAHLKLYAMDDERSRAAVAALRAGDVEQARAHIATIWNEERRAKGEQWLARRERARCLRRLHRRRIQPRMRE